MANPFLVRIKRITRQPLRIGSTNITNTDDGSVVDLSGVRVSQDLYRFLGRYIVLGPAESGFAAGNFNMDPNEATANLTALATQIALWTPMELGKGETITGLTYYAGTTLANTPANQVAGIYTLSADGLTLTQVALSTDKLTTPWAADTAQAFTGGTFPYTTPKADTYYFALLITATGSPSLTGRQPKSALVANLGVANGKAVAIGGGATATLTATVAVSSLTADNRIPLVQIIG